MVSSKKPLSLVVADCSPVSDALLAVTCAPSSGFCVTASRTTPETLPWGAALCASTAGARLKATAAMMEAGFIWNTTLADAHRRCQKLFSVKFGEHCFAHQIGWQEPLCQHQVVKLKMVEPVSQLLLRRLAQLQEPLVAVEVGRGLRRRAEGEAVHLLGGKGG